MLGAIVASWLWLTSPHFELLTDASEKAGRSALDRLEQIRQVFAGSIGARATPLPVRVFLFRSEREFRDYRPTEVAKGFYQSGPERDYIVMVDGTGETMRVVFHEYVHLVLHHSTASLPLWLEEGTAEFYSTLAWKNDRLVVGSPVENHVRVLLLNEWIDAAAMARLRKEDVDEASKAGMFYAQSWAMAHMLNMSARYRKNMPRFVELLDQAVPADLAFQQAFGVPFAQALQDLRAYVRNRSFAVAELMANRPESTAVEVEAATEERANLAQVELLLVMNRGALAERKLRGLNPSSGDGRVALGLLALSRKQNDEAKQRFLEAIQAGSRSATPYFEYAMLVRDSGGSRDEVRRYLAEAVGRNPKLAEAQFLLGLMSQQDGRHRDAIAPLEEAARVLPRQSYFWHALAISHHALGDSANARRAARKAADSANTRQELEMAQAVLRLTSAQSAEAGAPRRPSVTVPDTWKQREGDTRVEGVLEQIDCLGQNARFHVRSEGKPVALWVADPGKVLLKTASAITFEFSCGPQRPRRVTVDYTAAPDASRKVAGEIVAIEFR